MLCHPVPTAIIPVTKMPAVYTTVLPKNFGTEVVYTTSTGYPMNLWPPAAEPENLPKRSSVWEDKLSESFFNLSINYGPVGGPSHRSPTRPVPKKECNGPPPSYICNICHKGGHDIKMCPLARPKNESFTPYQGTKRCFGEFKCLRCRRTWMSGNSWANSFQQCKSCRCPVYPFRQSSLENPDGLDRSDQSRVHRSDLCHKCMENGGRYCRLHSRSSSGPTSTSSSPFSFN